MSIEELFMLDIQKKAMRQMHEDAFVNPGPEIPEDLSEPRTTEIPLKPKHSVTARLCWWLGSRLVKTGRRFLQYAG